MPLVPSTYNRNTKSPKFYSTATAVGHIGYNPVITTYYDSSDNTVRIEEVWRSKQYAQTISGSAFAQNWPDYTYTIITNAWVETTVS